jgi:SAM-dependent methyltransferase
MRRKPRTLDRPRGELDARPMSADPFDVFEREGWQHGRAAPYHRGLGPLTSRAVEPLLDAVAAGPGMRVLDVASGPGYGAARAAARGAEVTGADVSEEMVALAAELHPGIEFRAADAARLPFPDGSFDAVVSNSLMPHVADLPAVVAELARLLRPGGRLALSTWDPDAPGFLRALMQAVREAGATPPAGLPAGPDFFQYARDDELRGLLEGAGLGGATVAAHPFTHPIADLGAFLDEVVAGTVRMNALIASQTPDVRARIAERYAELLGPWRSADGYAVPFSVKVGAAARAAP